MSTRSTGKPYVEPGAQPLSELAAELAKRRAVANLRALGYEVTLEATAT
jgi:hypothetical protein